jgi:6-phosphogluconolactonase
MEQELYVYIGTYTEPILFGTGEIMPGKGEGIYLYRVDLEKGSLIFKDVFKNIANPSYLTVTPSQRFLYCVNELKKYNGADSGSVSAFSIDKTSGKLTYLNTVASHGQDPCYICVNKGETSAFVSNFMTGSVSMFPITDNGGLGEASCVIQHKGSSVHPKRQQGPHAHSVVLDSRNETALVPDLGIDRVVSYAVDGQKGRLLAQSDLDIIAAPGSGPRHCVFNKEGNALYVINELSLAVTVFSYNESAKKFSLIQSLDVVNKEDESAIGADITIHPGGKFLYASIRGVDVIIVCAVDPATHKLSLVSKTSCGGKTPRNFLVEPTGKYLIVGNQDSDSVVVYLIDQTTGGLNEVSRITVANPVCIKPIWL